MGRKVSRTSRWRRRRLANGVVIQEDAGDSSDSADEVDLPRPARLRYNPRGGRHPNVAGDVLDIVNQLNQSEPEEQVAEQQEAAGQHPGVAGNVLDNQLNESEPEELVAEQQEAAGRHPEVDGNVMDIVYQLNESDPEELVAEDREAAGGGNLNANNGLDMDNALSSNSERSSESEEESDNISDAEGEAEEVHPPADHLNDDRPLYQGAQVSVRESVIAILTYVLTHHLTGNSLIDLLSLIMLHCPLNSRCVKSLYTFQKFFKNVGKEILVFHYYCSVCYQSLTDKNQACGQCDRVTKVSYFIEIPMLQQLQILFKRPGFYEDLQFRFNRQKKHPNNVEDIYDGNIYKEHVQSGFLNNPNHISFMWYTDGVSIFNYSNKFSIWPLYLVINELSYKKRVKAENIILAGIWFGKSKPKANTFLQPFYNRMKEFSRDGYLLNRAAGPPVLVKGVMLCGTCDMPAKSLFLRIKQFNGFYGCPKCLQKGEQFEDTSVHVYRHSPNVPLRTNDSIELHSRAAISSGYACYGVRGVSLLYRMVSDMVRSTGIDSMHGAFSGLGKALLEYWFDPAHEGRDFSFLHVVESVNARLKQFKVPSFLNKFPQSVSDLTPWKSLDFKVWLLYYSIPVLSGLMADKYLDHHMLLVSAIYILSQRSISPRQIDQGYYLLNKYVLEFQQLYGLRYMGINVHQLTHLSECVQDLGPLWVYSCYFMEDLNGKICKFIHGTSHVGIQIATATTRVQELSSLILALNPQSPSRSFCDKVHKVGKNFKIAEGVSPGVNVIGKFCNIPVPPRQLLLQFINIEGGSCQLFSRLWSKGTLFIAESYTRALKRQSSFVTFKMDDTACLGSIKYFIRWSDCQCTVLCHCQPCLHLCVIQVYERTVWRSHFHADNVSFSYINAVRDTPEVVVVPVSSLGSLCFYLSVNDGIETYQYIVERVNNLEAE